MTSSKITPLPPLTGWADYEQALEHRERLRLDLSAAQREQERLEREQATADARDSRERAEAVRAGEKDPGAKHGPKNQAQVAKAREVAQVLADAVAQQNQALRDLIRAEPQQVRLAANATREQSTERYQAAVAELVEARAAFHRSGRMRHWAEQPLGRPWKDAPPPTIPVPGATLPSGDPVPTSAFLAALAAEAEGTSQPHSTGNVFTPGADQRGMALERNVKVLVPGGDVAGQGEQHMVMVPPAEAERLKAAHTKAEQDRMTLARDRAENLAALRQHAKVHGLPMPAAVVDDPLADLREDA